MDNELPSRFALPMILLLSLAGWVLVIGGVGLAAGVLGMFFDG